MPTSRLARFLNRHARWLFGLALIIVLFKVTQEVLEKQPIPLDYAILESLHKIVPATWLPFFKTITLSGSSAWLVPCVCVLVALLLIQRLPKEALQIGLSTVTAALVVYLVKTAVGRARPDLWSTQWYWGSSFPSGHTLASSAVATAIWYLVSRKAPAHLHVATFLLALWALLVGLSRLVLGVHWPTDVAAATCAGILVAAGVNFVVFRNIPASISDRRI